MGEPDRLGMGVWLKADTLRAGVRLKPDLHLRSDRNEGGRIVAGIGEKAATEKSFRIYATGPV
jgi:hypothetical protein